MHFSEGIARWRPSCACFRHRSFHEPQGVRHAPRTIHAWRRQKVTEYLLIAAILLGLVYLVSWVVTEAPRPRYPGIEKLRGDYVAPQAPGRPACSLVSTARSGPNRL